MRTRSMAVMQASIDRMSPEEFEEPECEECGDIMDWNKEKSCWECKECEKKED